MNILSGSIKFSDSPVPIGQHQFEFTESSFSDANSRIEIKRRKNHSSQNKSVYFDKGRLLVGFFGECHNFATLRSNYNNVETDVELIAAMYKQHGVECARKIDGLFTLLIIDLEKATTYILQDRFTSLTHLYYCTQKGRFLFSSDVRDLLRRVDDAPNINTKALPLFLRYSYVPTGDTLFDQISKLPSETILKLNMNNGCLRLEPLEYEQTYVYEGKPKKCDIIQYIKLFSRSLEDRLQGIGDQTVGMNLTAGFDTNFILHTILEKQLLSTINTFSIGTPDPNSEIHAVNKIVAAYRERGVDIQHHVYNVTGEEILQLPQFIYNSGEPNLQSGVVLQHCFAQIVGPTGMDIVLAGEGADQLFAQGTVFSSLPPQVREGWDFYAKSKIWLRPHIDFLTHYSHILFFHHFASGELRKLLSFKNERLLLSEEDPVWAFANYCLIKKICMKYINVTSRLPYLNQDLINFVSENIPIGMRKNKAFHKKVVLDLLPKNIKKLVTKGAGATPVGLLFSDTSTRDKIFQILLNDPDLKEYFNIEYIRDLSNHYNDICMNNNGSTNNLANKLFAIIGFWAWYKLYISPGNCYKKDNCDISLIDLLQSR